MDDEEAIPPEVATAVADFMAASRTGNITLNIKDGKILGLHVYEIINVQKKVRPAAGNGARWRQESPNRRI